MSQGSRTLRAAWLLDPGVTFLNHGSFGACPRAVLDEQAAWRARLEHEPVLFLARELEGLLDHTRAAVAGFVHCAPSELVFVTNATQGVNAVLGSLRFAPGDELLVTDHEYAASRHVLDRAALRAGATVVVAEVAFPPASASAIVDALLASVTARTRLALVDHVTSPTGLRFPIEGIVAALAARGIDTLVDGAHGPGMVDVDLGRLGAAYYTANCHKWIGAPKGSAFLHVRPDRQPAIRPTAISHPAIPDRDRSRYLQEFDWTGTFDPTAILSVPRALAWHAALLPGGWPALQAHEHALLLRARQILAGVPGMGAGADAPLLGSMLSLPLPGPLGPQGENDPLQQALWDRYRIEVPVFAWRGSRLLRISARIYNTESEYGRLADALGELLATDG